MPARVVAIVGSYRKGGTVDAAVEAVLAGARQKGAVTHTLYLTEQHIEFCNNCRTCTQEPGPERGKCAQHDDLEPILQEIEAADAVVLGSPVNCFNATAIFRRFMERLLGFTFWPWGQKMPELRVKSHPRKAVLVASSAAPGFLIPIVTGAARALRLTANMIGARIVGTLWIGLVAQQPHTPLSSSVLNRAFKLGMRLA